MSQRVNREKPQLREPPVKTGHLPRIDALGGPRPATRSVQLLEHGNGLGAGHLMGDRAERNQRRIMNRFRECGAAVGQHGRVDVAKVGVAQGRGDATIGDDTADEQMVYPNGAQDVLVLRDGEVEQLERLIPFVQGPIIQAVSLQDGLIVADWQPDF